LDLEIFCTIYIIFIWTFLGKNNNKFETNYSACKFFVEFFFGKSRNFDTRCLRTMFENWLIWTVWEPALKNLAEFFFQVFETLPRSVEQIGKKKVFNFWSILWCSQKWQSSIGKFSQIWLWTQIWKLKKNI